MPADNQDSQPGQDEEELNVEGLETVEGAPQSPAKPDKRSWIQRQMTSRKKPQDGEKDKKSPGETRLAFLSKARAKQVKTEDLSENDIIIAVMGPTGSGKSSFINTATGYEKGVGHTLESCTSEINVVKLTFPELASSDIFFVDTPGFDDTKKSDVDIFKMISAWLNDTYKKKIHLTGLLYFHRISDNRMAGTPLKNLRMFEKLCGSKFKNIILTTTMWDEVDEETGSEREEELKEIYWKSMIDRGSTTARFSQTRLSAFQILAPLIDEANRRDALLLQKEVTDLGLVLRQTSAGKTLFLELEHLVGKHQEMLERIREELRQPVADEDQLQFLMEEYQKLTTKLEATEKDMKTMKMPMGERLKRTFTLIVGWRRFASVIIPNFKPLFNTRTDIKPHASSENEQTSSVSSRQAAPQAPPDGLASEQESRPPKHAIYTGAQQAKTPPSNEKQPPVGSSGQKAYETPALLDSPPIISSRQIVDQEHIAAPTEREKSLEKRKTPSTAQEMKTIPQTILPIQTDADSQHASQKNHTHQWAQTSAQTSSQSPGRPVGALKTASERDSTANYGGKLSGRKIVEA